MLCLESKHTGSHAEPDNGVVRRVHGLGADFRRKSENRKSALWGRKAGPHQTFVFGFLRGGLIGSRLRASSDHRFIVGALRALGTYQATPSFFAAPASSPPS